MPRAWRRPARSSCGQDTNRPGTETSPAQAAPGEGTPHSPQWLQLGPPFYAPPSITPAPGNGAWGGGSRRCLHTGYAARKRRSSRTPAQLHSDPPKPSQSPVQLQGWHCSPLPALPSWHPPLPRRRGLLQQARARSGRRLSACPGSERGRRREQTASLSGGGKERDTG